MRILLPLMIATLLSAPAQAVKPTPEAPDALAGAPILVEEDTYRYGYPYRSERGTTVEACAMACSNDASCAAWSLTPATFKMGPRCELKKAPGETSFRPGSTSGISELWHPDPDRHGEMRYEVAVPESRQPAAVPVDQLRPSPVPQVFGDPLPAHEPELLGDASAVPAPPSAPAPVLVDAVTKRPRPAAPSTPPATVNAVLKRTSSAPAAPPVPAPEPAPAALPARTPWTERTSAAPDYSVGESDFIPGDEQATGGLAPISAEPNS